MRNIIKSLVVVAALLFGSTGCSDGAGNSTGQGVATPQGNPAQQGNAAPQGNAVPQGGGYALLSPAQPTSTNNKIEVIEFFFYECSHCNDLHPLLAAWEKSKPQDVEMVYVPAIFRSSLEPLARTYFALKHMGKIGQMDDAIYKGIHTQNAQLYDLDSIADFVAKQGVDRARFADDYKSFTTNIEVERAKQMIRSYGVQGTPTLVVDGKYVISGLHPADTIRVLNEVVALARKERSKKK